MSQKSDSISSRSGALGIDSLPYPDSGTDPRPRFRFGGRWLRDAGFEIGDTVTVEVSPRCLIITATRTAYRRGRNLTNEEGGRP